MADGNIVTDERRTADFQDDGNERQTDDEKLERQYFWKVVEAFLYYK